MIIGGARTRASASKVKGNARRVQSGLGIVSTCLPLLQAAVSQVLNMRLTLNLFYVVFVDGISYLVVVIPKIMKPLFLVAFILVFGSCAMMQSIVKSTFPYTTTVTIPQADKPGEEHSVTAMATSFDQDFRKDGNNGAKVSEVRIISAKLESREPSDFNIGNLAWVKIYMAKADGTDEVLVASRTDITASVGNTMVLDIDNSSFLDQRVREAQVKIRMAYKLRNAIEGSPSLHIVLGLSAYPNR